MGERQRQAKFLWLAGLALCPTFPGLHFQGPAGQTLAGFLPTRLGDEVSIQVRTQVLQVGRRRDRFAERIQPETGAGKRPQVVDIADHFQAGGYAAGGGQFLRPVVIQAGLCASVLRAARKAGSAARPGG